VHHPRSTHSLGFPAWWRIGIRPICQCDTYIDRFTRMYDMCHIIICVTLAYGPQRLQSGRILPRSTSTFRMWHMCKQPWAQLHCIGSISGCFGVWQVRSRRPRLGPAQNGLQDGSTFEMGLTFMPSKVFRRLLDCGASLGGARGDMPQAASDTRGRVPPVFVSGVSVHAHRPVQLSAAARCCTYRCYISTQQR
jgi:hypothetical protein